MSKQAPSFQIEQLHIDEGFALVAGIDEAGRGPLAGPVVAAAVILSPDNMIIGLNDSKKLSHGKRESLFKDISAKAANIGIGIVDCRMIDSINILNATLMAMKQAVQNLGVLPDILLIDGNKTIAGMKIKQKAIVKGDSISFSIAAASIVAKVTRDRIMLRMHKKYPQFGFDRHKGYGTKAHMEALKAYGALPIHRFSFAPVKLYGSRP